MKKENGQSLVEVLIVLVVASIMIVSLIGAIILGMKNAQFAQNQTKATKLAQEAIDKTKAIRDRNNEVIFATTALPPANCPAYPSHGCSGNICHFADLWSFNLSAPSGSPCSGSCNFKINRSGTEDRLEEISGSPSAFADLGDNFARKITLRDESTTCGSQKWLEVRVKWTDSSGEHESFLETILTRN